MKLPSTLRQSTEPAPDQRKVNGNCLGVEGPIRLNLGGIGEEERNGRNGCIPGFLTVDIQDSPRTDIVADCSDLSMFKDQSVDEIYASNILEHFPHTRTQYVLEEWRRVLKPRHKLWISVPDMDAHFRLYQEFGLVPWVVNLIWGDQYHPLAYHYVNFTFASLAAVVMKAGFYDIKRVSSFPYKIQDASVHLDSAHKKPVSLNVEITA